MSDRPVTKCQNKDCRIYRWAQWMTRDGRCRVCGTPLPVKEAKSGSESAHIANLIRRDAEFRAENDRIGAIIGKRLRIFRLARKLTQLQLAHAFGGTRALISQWELGRVNILPNRLVRCCKVLGVSPAALLFGL